MRQRIDTDRGLLVYGGPGEAGGSCCPLCPYPRRGPVVFRPPGGGSALYPGGGVRVVLGERVPRTILPETDLDAVKGDQPVSH